MKLNKWMMVAAVAILAIGAVALSLATFMNVLDTSIANVSIPAISGDLGVSPDQGTWVITSFGVANAISLPLTGWMTRRYGQVRLFTWSLALFVAAAAAFRIGRTARDEAVSEQHIVAFGDLDNDGRIDVVVTTLDGPVKLFHKITTGAGHWLAVRLRGTRANRQGLGAVVSVTLPDGRVLYGHATTSVGYASSSEPLVRFGLGPHTAVKQVEVRWPGGGSQKLAGVTGDRILEIEEAKP